MSIIEIKKLSEHKTIIFFDADCLMCSRFVIWLLQKDRKNAFVFASLNGEVGLTVINHFKITSDSVIVMHGEELFLESDAVIKIFSQMSGLWRTLHLLRYVPKFCRNGVYRWIARNRKSLFGSSQKCILPTDNYPKKFL